MKEIVIVKNGIINSVGEREKIVSLHKRLEHNFMDSTNVKVVFEENPVTPIFLSQDIKADKVTKLLDGVSDEIDKYLDSKESLNKFLPYITKTECIIYLEIDSED